MSLMVPAFAATGVALLLGGWVLQRRQRLAPPAVQRPDAMQSDQQPVDAPPAAVRLDAMSEFAAQLEGEPEPVQPQLSAPVPLERSHRVSRWLRVTHQKRLIKSLMWVRTLMGAAAILAAIAIVVFWAIESLDLRAGETGLTRPLLILLLAGWALSWGAGLLANQLHRAFFGRVHPKFDN